MLNLHVKAQPVARYHGEAGHVLERVALFDLDIAVRGGDRMGQSELHITGDDDHSLRFAQSLVGRDQWIGLGNPAPEGASASSAQIQGHE